MQSVGVWKGCWVSSYGAIREWKVGSFMRMHPRSSRNADGQEALLLARVKEGVGLPYARRLTRAYSCQSLLVNSVFVSQPVVHSRGMQQPPGPLLLINIDERDLFAERHSFQRGIQDQLGENVQVLQLRVLLRALRSLGSADRPTGMYTIILW